VCNLRWDQAKIRAYTIIGHIDHGKSTLADRILELTGAIPERRMRDQFLDRLDLERERGITIKAKTITFSYQAKDGHEYQLNLVDCPGHVDFTYEVSKSLAACEGALLVIDASQGVQAQTVANLYLALEHDLVIIPILNKIDLPEALPELVEAQIEEELGLPREDILRISAKEGVGIEEVLEAIVQRIPPPGGDPKKPLRALIYDSTYDPYKGAIPSIKVVDGFVKPGMRIRMMGKDTEFEVEEVGIFTPDLTPKEELLAGEVGYLAAKIKNVRDIGLGDTITTATNPCKEALPGYRPLKPMVFCGLYPTTEGQFGALRDALEKLSLNDASFNFVEETSAALGHGFRVGFLGLLHAEIIQERLEREYGLSLIATAPNVEYKVVKRTGETVMIENPSLFPDPSQIHHVEEPYVRAKIITPERFIGNIIELLEGRRGKYVEMKFSSDGRAFIGYELPLGEIALDLYDKLKARSSGYASFDYEFKGFQESDLVKLEILVNKEPVDALSTIVHREKAYQVGKAIVKRLKGQIPRKMFPIPLQAAIGKKVIARETIPAYRKDVTAGLSGGDVTRKRKLLEKQKLGKKRLKEFGHVDIPQEAFLAILER